MRSWNVSSRRFSNEESISESGVYKSLSLSVERSVFTSRLFIFAGTRSGVKINEGKGILLSKPKFKATPITRIINSAWENRQTTNYYPTHRERISLPVENYSHNNNLIAILDVQFLIRR